MIDILFLGNLFVISSAATLLWIKKSDIKKLIYLRGEECFLVGLPSKRERERGREIEILNS